MRQAGKTEFQKLYEQLAIHHFNGGTFEMTNDGPYLTVRLINKKHSQFPCPTTNCGGDGRYAAPGRGHREGCGWPRLEGERDTGTIEEYLKLSVMREARYLRQKADLLAAGEPGVPDE